MFFGLPLAHLVTDLWVWTKDKPMPRLEHRRRVICWSCQTRGNCAHECPTTADRPQGSGGGPSASFMTTAAATRRNGDDDRPSAEMPPCGGDGPRLIDLGTSDNMEL